MSVRTRPAVDVVKGLAEIAGQWVGGGDSVRPDLGLHGVVPDIC